jgi:4-hydroxythreonine-4-phosphate dehydrogenase
MLKPKRKIRVGITMGDPSGIGPYITGEALKKLKGLAEFTVVGDKRVFERSQGRKAARSQDYRFIDLKNVPEKNFKFGQIRVEYGRASIEYLDKALELVGKNEIDCIVTCPISKEAINLAGYKYSGHTEYFSQKTGVDDFVMMLLNSRLKISLVTRHSPLARVTSEITEEKIYKTILLTRKSLKELFSLKKPRLVVCGVNPHASDNGLIGDEENNIVKPALKRLAAIADSGSIIDGPLSADVAIAKAAQGEYDCVIAMYHDQALIPLKLSDDKNGVNITLGLSFVRTSPLHGTAFDVAAAGLRGAKADSLIAAIKLAVKCASVQKNA